MIIECVHCHAKYQYDDSKFDGKPSKKIRCAKCQQVFEISAPAEGGATASAPPAGAKPKVTDDTVSRPIRTFSGSAATAGEGLLAGAKRGEGYPPLPDGKRYSVAIIDGPDSGSVIRIDKSHVVIGRSGADVPLNDNEVSRNHAAIDIRGALMLLEDTGSTNGTLVHGERITAPIELQNHSEFTVGSTTLMIIVTDTD